MSAILAYGYLRLSDEEFKNGESGSIQNQRTSIKQYCDNHGITLIREFSDDGYSGGNFDRPGFNEMLRYLKRNEVTMVLTKDLSRLGRDMRESSYYAETFFPEHGIHYIAINDNFDSEQENILAPFQFAMNDVYLRDTSKKVKTVLKTKKQSGEYAACPPYGYKKDPQKKDRLIPDENTAPVVQQIFSLAIKGNSTRAICDKLNEQKIIPPLKYRVLYRDDFGQAGASRASDLWNYVTVRRILQNEVYLGHTLLGKTKKASLKAKKKIDVDRGQWLVTKNTHEPLVTEETFDLAQNRIKTASKKWQQYDNVRKSIFRGVVFCAHCGAAMCSAGTVYKGERDRYWYLQCNNLPSRSAHCCQHPARIKYSDLIDIVTQELNYLTSLSDEEIETVIGHVRNDIDSSKKQKETREKIEALRHRQKQIDDMIIKLYQDNIEGKLSDERLERVLASLEEETARNDNSLKKLGESIESTSQIKDNYKQFFELVKGATHIEKLTAEIVRTFISRIEISERVLPDGAVSAGPKTPCTQEIRIFYRFIGEISANPMKRINRPEN